MSSAIVSLDANQQSYVTKLMNDVAKGLNESHERQMERLQKKDEEHKQEQKELRDKADKEKEERHKIEIEKARAEERHKIEIEKAIEKARRKERLLIIEEKEGARGSKSSTNDESDDDDLDDSGSESDDKEKDPSFGTMNKKRQQNAKKAKSSFNTSSGACKFINKVANHVPRGQRSWFRANSTALLKQGKYKKKMGNTSCFGKLCEAIYRNYTNAKITDKGIDLGNDNDQAPSFLPFQLQVEGTRISEI